MPDTIYQREARCARPGGVVLGRPGVGHGHPQVEAKEGDDRSNGSQGKAARCSYCHQNAAKHGEYRCNGQPQLALQSFTEEVSKDRCCNEAKGAECRDQPRLWRRFLWRNRQNGCQQDREALSNRVDRDIAQEPDN